jgi:hypothetical protein
MSEYNEFKWCSEGLKPNKFIELIPSEETST